MGIHWVPNPPGASPGSAEGMFWPAKRHPALPTACPGACKVLQGVRVPGRKSECACGEADSGNIWGWRTAPLLDSQELGRSQCKQTLCSSSQGFSGSRQCSSSFRLHNPALNGLSAQWSLLSRKGKLRHQIKDILQMYLLQFKSWFVFFFKFWARVSYYCLLTGSWLTIFHSCQIMLDKAEFIMDLLLVSQFHHSCVS